MGSIVSDASALIALAKMGRLELLRALYGQVIIGTVVKEEVFDQGKAISAPGVEHVEKGLEERWIRLAPLTAREKKLMRRILKTTRLDLGEAESLAVAHSRKLMLIVDDREARALAAAMHLEFLGTAGVLLEAFLKGRLTLEELEDAVQELSGVIWLSPTVVTEILKRAREAGK